MEQKITAKEHRSVLSLALQASYVAVALTIAVGIVYPVVTTVVAKAVFPDQASGSIVQYEGKDVGSSMIGQNFDKTPYFKSRPSAVDYNAAGTSGSNFGPSNPKQIEAINQRAAYWKEQGGVGTIPTDLLTASGSGIDPNISRKAAEYQLPIVAKATGIDESKLRELVDAHTEGGLFGGPQYVNVLLLNLDVDKLYKAGK